MEQRIRLDLRVDKPRPQKFGFSGFHLPLPAEDVFELWVQYDKHGVLMHGGGWYDQPAEYRHDMKLFDAMAGYYYASYRKDD